MKRYPILFLALLLCILGFGQQNVSFDQYFTRQTMRVDYFHSGTSTQEHFSPDRILNDGPWAGSETMLLDGLNRGLYFFTVTDTLTNTLLYSRGFASVFGEWQSIPEAETNWGTYPESIRIPWPKVPVRLTIEKRDAKNIFAPMWSIVIDPKSRTVNPAVLHSPYKTFAYIENGKTSNHVDIVILGDGYTEAEMPKFQKDVATLADELFTVEPFKSHKSDFNVRAVETPSATSGVNKPHPGVFNRTPLSMSYGAFDSERYALSYDNRTLRDVAASVPYDYMFILINERTYGG
ncbi:MAG: M64 family metallopeptidase, partial [Bacteroidota bacterium]